MNPLRDRVFETRAIDHYANPPFTSSFLSQLETSALKNRSAPEWGRTTKPLDPQSNALSIELRVHTIRASYLTTKGQTVGDILVYFDLQINF